MSAPVSLHGLMIEFTLPDEVLAATRRAWEAGYRDMDAYTPYPVEGLATALGLKHSRIPSLVFCGALAGGGVGFLMQYYTMAVDYPFNSGGRPLNSWPAFIPITFELLVLVSSLSAFLGMLFLNGLPMPNHPVFSVPGFERASQDRFFLCIEATDARFDLAATRAFLSQLVPDGRVMEVAKERLVEPEEPPADATAALVPEPRVPTTQSGDR
ncbi:MAG TPA: DUF3341 domain-containing protein [Steroidobacteraceae bacterium]|jgi:hypothetical protein